LVGLIAFLSAILTNTTLTNSSTFTNPLHFESLIDKWFPIRIISLIICFMMSFFFFSQAMRFLNHAVILINVHLSDIELQHLNSKDEAACKLLSPNVVDDIVNRGAFSTTAGFRMFYISFPIIAWIGSPWYLIATSVILIAVLRHLDFNIKLEKKVHENGKKAWWTRRWLISESQQATEGQNGSE
jgi:uncharacterized membrane protein